MKRLLFISGIILLLPFICAAQANLQVNFMPSMIKVNSFNTTSFDPMDPGSQPIITTLSIHNPNPTPTRIDLKVAIYWNNFLLAQTVFCSKENYTLGSCRLTNRDLITSEPNPNFEFKGGSSGLSLDDILNASSTLKSAILAGHFPDGEFRFKVWVREFDYASWEGEDNSPSAEFKIIIQNAGNLTLLSPGIPIGQIPVKVSGLPISFLWNSQLTGFNEYKLVIREYSPENRPTVNNVERTGAVFYETPAGKNESSGFSDFLPFADGNYYAWRVSTSMVNEYNPIMRNGDSNELFSEWFVFQYVSEQEANNAVSEFQTHLNMLQNNTLQNLQLSGYIPVGVVIINGRTYSGLEAINLIDALQGQDISVELKN